MKSIWEVGEHTTLVADISFFGKRVVAVNGREVLRTRSLRTRRAIPFPFPTGARACS